MKVEVKSQEEITVEVPRRGDVDIDLLLKKHRTLLEKKYTQFLEKKPILTDDSILYKGQYHKLIFNEVEKTPVSLN